jgi:hypothetical protein
MAEKQVEDLVFTDWVLAKKEFNQYDVSGGAKVLMR